VRAAQTPSAIDTVSQLEPGRELVLDRNVTAPFAPGTAVASVALSRTPGIDVPALLRALDKYPYGCLEQTTSRALPLLYYNDVALLGYGPGDPRISDRSTDSTSCSSRAASLAKLPVRHRRSAASMAATASAATRPLIPSATIISASTAPGRRLFTARSASSR